VVERVRGGCPSCGAQTSFFVGAGHMAARWPLSSQCGACGIGVRFTPVNSAVR
jgi:ribosomal protein S27AE